MKWLDAADRRLLAQAVIVVLAAVLVLLLLAATLGLSLRLFLWAAG